MYTVERTQTELQTGLELKFTQHLQQRTVGFYRPDKTDSGFDFWLPQMGNYGE